MGKNVSLIDGHIDGADTCAICGREIPEDSKYCIMCGYKQTPKKQRQVDRIRNMSVDELAVFLHKHLNCHICLFKNTCTYKECEEGIKKWLESGTDEGAKENGF